MKRLIAITLLICLLLPMACTQSESHPIVHYGEITGYYHMTLNSKPTTIIYFIDGSKLEIRGHYNFQLETEYCITTTSGYIPTELISAEVIYDKNKEN